DRHGFSLSQVQHSGFRAGERGGGRSRRVNFHLPRRDRHGAEMTSISGIMKLGEADATRRDIARRFQMTGQAGYFLLLGLVLLGAAIGAIVSHGPGMAIGVAAGFVAYWSIAGRFARDRFRRQLVARGLP